MFGFLSKYFHKEITSLEQTSHVPVYEELWPKEWTTVSFKEYERLPNIPLPSPQSPTITLGEILHSRHSSRDFDITKKPSLQEISSLLSLSLGGGQIGIGLPKTSDVLSLSRRSYPSGGGRYPLETYVYLREVDLLNGLYHYNVKKHSLEEILNGEVGLDNALKYPWSKEAPMVLIMTAIWDRNFIKYHDFGYRLVLLEAGHAMQNVQLVAEALGLKYCSTAGYDTEKIAEILDLDLLEEAPVYMTVIGK